MEKGDKQLADPKKAIGTVAAQYKVTINSKDMILYALGIGFQ